MRMQRLFAAAGDGSVQWQLVYLCTVFLLLYPLDSVEVFHPLSVSLSLIAKGKRPVVLRNLEKPYCDSE